jgi:nuclear pore complex protein Nup107
VRLDPLCLYLAPHTRAVQSSLKTYERALYGFLSGHVDAVLPACETWEDHLWAYAQTIFGDEADRRLAESEDGRFWSGAPHDGERRSAVNVKQALADTFERLQESDNRAVRAAARNPFRIAQRFLVLGQIDRLFDEFAAELEARANELSEEYVPSSSF